MQEANKSEIYNVWNFDLKFAANKELGCKNSLINIGFWSAYAYSIYFATLSNKHKLTSLILDCFVSEMLLNVV